MRKPKRFLLRCRKNIKAKRIKLSQAERIGLFGGTFDPIHLGHTIVAEWLQYKLNLCEVYFIPNYKHPFNKRRDISESRHRLNMLNIALSNFPPFKISQYEIDKEEISYSIDTIRYFHNQYPDKELYYLIGGDNIKEFSAWKDYNDIFKLAKVVVYRREEEQSEISDKFIFVNSPRIEISSSQIREYIKKNIPCRSLLHPDVFRYIKENELYTAA